MKAFKHIGMADVQKTIKLFHLTILAGHSPYLYKYRISLFWAITFTNLMFPENIVRRKYAT
jgi:hypothetical protein